MINKLKASILSLLLFSLFGCSDNKSKELASDIAFVDSLMSRMTLEEKLGQMTQVDRQFLSDISDISKYGLGSLLSGGGSTPEVNEPKAWADMYDSYQREALKSRLKIPLIYGIDAVHGHNNVIGATIFPHNIGLGATRDPQIVEAVARATALEVAATGIDWDFAPCLAVPDDFRWGRTYEGFSEDTDLVSELGGAAVRGYQSTNE
jgi:beta-glucosidase